jgi:hypothetical protein
MAPTAIYARPTDVRLEVREPVLATSPPTHFGCRPAGEAAG